MSGSKGQPRFKRVLYPFPPVYGKFRRLPPLPSPYVLKLLNSGSETSRHYLAGVPQSTLPTIENSSHYGESKHGDFPVAGVATGFGTMNNQPYIVIGERDGWGQPQPFGISAADQRQHIYIIGKTGSGKTTLLRNLIIQHIAVGSKNSVAVEVIDSVGFIARPIRRARGYLSAPAPPFQSHLYSPFGRASRQRKGENILLPGLLLVLLQRRQHDLGFAGVGPMYRLTVMAQSLLGSG